MLKVVDYTSGIKQNLGTVILHERFYDNSKCGIETYLILRLLSYLYRYF